MEGLRSLLDSAEELRVVAADTSLVSAMESVRTLRPAILLVDKSFGAQVIAEWIETLRLSSVPAAAVVWGAFMSEPEALRFLKVGAAGVIRKTASLSKMLMCLRTVASGGTWVDEDLIGDHPYRNGRSSLTSREAQVRGLVERGLKNKDIGAALGISPGTVKIHLKHIFEKTGVRGRYGLAVSGLREKGLLAPSAQLM